ncbi:MAG: tRNA (adenosine(37)-N6)-threonylcarbamoyltransferase complex dimerization subunit type 1 TsaB [Pseudomonadota bacterium]
MGPEILTLKILAFDTSGDFGVAGTVRGLRLIEKMAGKSPRAASEGLLPWIMEVTVRSGWKPADLDLIAVGSGPGSFTGTRIAVAVAKGLAEVLGTALVSVSSLEAAALTWGQPGTTIAVVMDARKGDVLMGVYGIGVRRETCGEAHLELPEARVLDPPSLCSPGEAARRLGRLGRALPSLAVCGSGESADPHMFDGLRSGIKILGEPGSLLVDPLAIARLAVKRLMMGERDDPSTLEPVYLRTISSPR